MLATLNLYSNSSSLFEIDGIDQI